MSLLDDVSIVVTPNGYKAGELYAVVPVPTEGAEEVNDKDFLLTGTQAENTTGTYWTTGTGWTISSGTSIVTNGAIYSRLSQSLSFDLNSTYQVTIECSQFSNGYVYLRKPRGSESDTTLRVDAVGTFKFTLQALTDIDEIALSIGEAGTNLTISSISVKEVLLASADMDVTRATAGTRVDEDGLVNYAEVIGGELVTDGEFPSNTNWNESNAACEIIGGKAVWTSAPNSTGFTGINLNNAICEIGKTYKITYTIDSITEGGLRIRFPDFGTQFNSSGTYPLTVTNTLTATSTNIYFQGLGTTTASISNVSVKEVDRDNVPRIDYTGGGCPHILAEPQRTNLIPYSEEISQYSKTQTTVIDNNTTSPDGTVNASKVTKNGVSENDRVFVNNLVISNTTDYSLSAFIKNDDIVNGGVSTIGARITGGTFFRQGYDWNGNTLSLSSSYNNGARTNVLLEDFGNGWWKIGFSFTSDGTEADLEFDIDRVNGTDTTSIFLWGAQYEEGSYGTSYISNFGTVAGVTRNQDIFTRDGIGSLIGSEGVLFVEMAALANDGTNRGISLNDGTATNRLLLYFSAASNQIAVISTGFTGSIIYTLPDETLFNKIAVRYKANDITLWVDGESRGTPITSATIPTFTALKFDSGIGASPFFGKVKQLQVYDTALGGSPYNATLSNTRLAALTS